MKASKREIFFFCSIAGLSLLSMIFPGVYLGVSKTIEFSEIDIESVRNIQYGIIHRAPKDGIAFCGGYPTLTTGQNVHSDFYNGNISLIRTSPYWRNPVEEPGSLLLARKDGIGYEMQLFLKDMPTLPIVSLICDPNGFFSYDNGIYVQGVKSDFTASVNFYPMPWQKPANYYYNKNDDRKIHFTFYNINGSVKCSSYSLAEISGNATRCFPQKSLRVKFKPERKHKKGNFDILNDGKIYETLILRNGGNDNTKSLFRDMLIQNLLYPTGVLVSGFVLCEVYLNGQYWGIHFIQNRFERDFVSVKYSTKPKNVTIVENWQFEKGNEKKFQKLIETIKRDNLEYHLISETFDLKNLSAYLAGQIFMANTDWPQNNVKMYLIEEGSESLWKFAFFDMDYGFGYTGKESVETDMMEILNKRKDPLSRIFRVLVQNDNFRMMLKSDLYKLVEKYCTNEKMLDAISGLGSNLEKNIRHHTERWGVPYGYENWKGEIEILKHFAKNRGKVILKQIKVYLDDEY